MKPVTLAKFELDRISPQECMEQTAQALQGLHNPILTTSCQLENRERLRLMQQQKKGIYPHYLNFPSSDIITNGNPLPPGSFNDLPCCLSSMTQDQIPAAFIGSTLVVDSYGYIQIAGHKKSDPNNHEVGVLLPDITNCLGLGIKDIYGNLTVRHDMISQGYSKETIVKSIEAHNETFKTDPKEYFITVAGMALSPESFNNQPFSGLPSQSIDPTLLIQDIERYYHCRRLQLIPNEILYMNDYYIGVHNTNLLTTNSPTDNQCTYIQRPISFPMTSLLQD